MAARSQRPGGPFAVRLPTQGAASAGIAPIVHQSQTEFTQRGRERMAMEYRSLGRTGVQVSALCLGCMNFGWGTEEDESTRIMHAAIDSGVNFFDTANVYGRGSSEEVVGRAVSHGGRRERVFLATKVHG